MPGPRPGNSRIMPPGPVPADVFVTRLHVRYDAQSFPEDLRFQSTGDRTNFQGRYVMQHAWEGTASCAAADDYRKQLRVRREDEARTLANLTGWDLEDIRKKIGIGNEPAPESTPWWRQLWPNS